MQAGIREQRARIESLSRKLAHSGEHQGWWSIKSVLLTQGPCPAIDRVFSNLWTCSELDRLCEEEKRRSKEHRAG